MSIMGAKSSTVRIVKGVLVFAYVSYPSLDISLAHAPMPVNMMTGVAQKEFMRIFEQQGF
jgi:hypothetical protein